MTPLNARTDDLLAPLDAIASRWILPNERLLWALLIGAYALDLATTAFGLSIGLAEGNPIAASILAAYGMPSLVGLKLLALAAGLLCRSFVPDRHGAVVPLGLALPSAGAVLLNACAIAAAL